MSLKSVLRAVGQSKKSITRKQTEKLAREIAREDRKAVRKGSKDR